MSKETNNSEKIPTFQFLNTNVQLHPSLNAGNTTNGENNSNVPFCNILAPGFHFPPAAPSIDFNASSSTIDASDGMRTGVASSGNGKKRSGSRRDGELDMDDILGQITQKLNSLTTAGQPNWSDSELMNTLMEVLDIDTSQAQFFLESAAYNVELAVSIYMEMQQSQYYNMQSSSSFLLQQQQYKKRSTRGYVGREVEIVGLPEGWTARVSRHSGEVYFINTETGHSQNAVPPGFADAVKEPTMELDLESDPSLEMGSSASSGVEENHHVDQTSGNAAGMETDGVGRDDAGH